MQRRRYLAAGFGVAASIIGSSGATAGIGTVQEREREPHQFGDTGATVTDEFELAGGVTIIEARHDGDSNFVVELIPTEDGREDLLINTIGAYDGAAGTLAEPGSYLLDIDADGDWEIDVRQPSATAAEAESLPVELDGSGPAWDGPFQFDGLGHARGVHDGERNFIVEILPQDGLFTELVFNEIGRFEGETTFDIDGIGYVIVDADGSWSVTME